MLVLICVKTAVVVTLFSLIAWGCIVAMREQSESYQNTCRTCKHNGKCSGRKWFSCFRNSWKDWVKKQ